MHILLSWSDRGVRGPRPSHHTSRAPSDPGPVLRLVSESTSIYDQVIVLTTKLGREPAQGLADDLRPYITDRNLHEVDLPDPSDYERIFAVTRDLVGTLSEADDIDVVLSAGTPQMQTIWVVLVKAGLLNARMLQVIPPAFVPNPHPKAIKQVRLDFDGFPEILALRQEVQRLRAETDVGATGLLGSSSAMLTLRRLISRVGASDVPLLVTGETGTGKELVAKGIHQASRRKEQPFIVENCGAFNENVLHSELFGHEKGAFTGAHSQRRGLFEQAHGGTLFLDEVAELSPRVQATLLRVLQEGTLRRLGGEEEIEVDVRIIAATHRNLREMIHSGEFRQDLYYRLRGAEILVPPLRERVTDIPQLTRSFLSDLSGQPRITEQAMQAMMRYPWPGNVRELRSEVVRWTVFGGKLIRCSDLAPEIRGLSEPQLGSRVPAPSPTRPRSLKEAVHQAEDEAIQQALDAAEGNLSQTARALEIDRNTLKKKLARMGLRTP